MAEVESTVAHGPEHGLERLIFFSDAVFAIAITLLVIEIHVPHLPRGSADHAYWEALAELVPDFIGFFISFFVVGAFWAGHHRAMSCAAHWDPRLFGPNLLLLSTVAAVPFFTAFASANPVSRVPTFCYAFWLLVVALLNRRLQRIVTAPPVVDEAVPAVTIAAIRRRGTAVILGAATAMLVSLIYPGLGQLALGTIPLWRIGLDRLAERCGPRVSP